MPRTGAGRVGFGLIALAGALCAAERDELGNEELERYFEQRVTELERPLAGIQSLDEWQARRPALERQLREMLGLHPAPKRTPLQAVVTGRVERDRFTVENLHFQSRPGLYVSANLYLPKQHDGKVPGILYLCGHARVEVDGISHGNKVAYHHHGVWFARHGYACLIIDTIQLGEIEGVHHGTYRHDRWWWNARGYTPAGVEAWNGIRALDYLQGRPEVDGGRLGVTGRSGGGAYSWFVAALDERVAAAVPVAGIASLRDHVIDGCIEGHCDCMFPVNTHGWDFETVAALVAPRPLLVSNTDKDPIFPLDGVLQVHRGTRHIYDLHGSDSLGLHIEEGPHQDTQPLRISAFHWFNRQLQGAALDHTFAMPAEKVFEPHELKVFDSIPENEMVTRVDESFVPAAAAPNPPETEDEWRPMRDRWLAELRRQCLRGWPEAGNPVIGGDRIRTQEHVRCAIRLPESADRRRLVLRVLGEGERPPEDSDTAVFAPRGVPAGEWPADPRKRTHIRRRFALVGQTLDGMRAWDIVQAVRALRSSGWGADSLTIEADGVMAGNVLYASLFFDEPPQRLVLRNPPTSHRDGPIFLNVLKLLDLPQALAMAAERGPLELVTSEPQAWSFATETAERLGWESRLRIEPAAPPSDR